MDQLYQSSRGLCSPHDREALPMTILIVKTVWTSLLLMYALNTFWKLFVDNFQQYKYKAALNQLLKQLPLLYIFAPLIFKSGSLKSALLLKFSSLSSVQVCKAEDKL